MRHEKYPTPIPHNVLPRYLFEENSVARAGRRFAVRVPERCVAPVHVTFETDGTRAARERRRGVRRHHRSLPVRRPPPDRLAIADRPPVVAVVVGIVAVVATAASAKSVTVAVTEVGVVTVVVTAAVTVVVIATITVATGAQSGADKREQLLYVSVELVGQASDAGRGHRRVCPVSKYVRLEVYRLGVSRLLRTILTLRRLILPVFALLPVLLLLLQVLRLLLRRGIRVGRRGGDVQRLFRPVRFDHFHRRTVRLLLFRDRRNAAVVVHARQHRRRSAFGARRPPSPSAPQTITPQRRLLLVHRRLVRVAFGRCPGLLYFIISYSIVVSAALTQLNVVVAKRQFRYDAAVIRYGPVDYTRRSIVKMCGVFEMRYRK